MSGIGGGTDSMTWNGNSNGKFTTTMAVEKLRFKEQQLVWPSFIWKYFLHPCIACNVWKLLQGVYIDDDTMRKEGYGMPSRCCVCEAEQDNMEHTLWRCDFSAQIWNRLCFVFAFPKPSSFTDVCTATSYHSPLVKEVWFTAACATMRELWFQKNLILFDNGKVNTHKFKSKILQVVHEGGIRMKGNRWAYNYDSQIISFFNLSPKIACHKT